MVENSLKHDNGNNTTELKVILKIYKNPEFLFIEIENDGELLTQSYEELLQSGTGLKNTQDRLKTLYGNEVEFTLKNSNSRNGVITFIKIPLKH
jgi:LytS/YehU family sensor histidine kinase